MRCRFLVPALMFLGLSGTSYSEVAADAEKWLTDLTGESVEDIEDFLDLSYNLGASKGCFPESQLENLCQLDLSHVTKLAMFRDKCELAAKLTDQALRTIGRCLPNLEILDADYNNFSNPDLSQLPKSLLRLELKGNAQELAAESLATLGQLPKLQTLHLQNTTISQEAFDLLYLPNLAFLYLNANDLASLESLPTNLAGLRSLAVEKASPWSEADLKAVLATPEVLNLTMVKSGINAGMVLAEATMDWYKNAAESIWLDRDLIGDDLASFLAVPRKTIWIATRLSAAEYSQVLAAKAEKVVFVTMVADDVPLIKQAFSTMTGPCQGQIYLAGAKLIKMIDFGIFARLDQEIAAAGKELCPAMASFRVNSKGITTVQDLAVQPE